MKTLSRTFLTLSAIACACVANAGPIMNHADVNGLTTFQDVATGRVWVDLNNYFDLSYNAMKADVESKGFTVGDVFDVHELLDTLPLGGGEWSGYAVIMGSVPNRDLIFGAYVPECRSEFYPDCTVSWAYAYIIDPYWGFTGDTGWPLDTVVSGGTPLADMNIWAYQAGTAPVPEPSTFVMVGGLALAAVLNRLRRR